LLSLAISYARRAEDRRTTLMARLLAKNLKEIHE
jgi:hypothetical protein